MSALSHMFSFSPSLRSILQMLLPAHIHLRRVRKLTCPTMFAPILADDEMLTRMFRFEWLIYFAISTWEVLITAKKKSATLTKCFRAALDPEGVGSKLHKFFVDNGILMHRWAPHDTRQTKTAAPAHDCNWDAVYQIVILSVYHQHVCTWHTTTRDLDIWV